MKKIILSVLGLSLMLNMAKAQVGISAYDDFADSDAGTAGYQEYGTASGGIFWFKDAAFASTYTLTRSETLAIAVNKSTEYSVIGLGFGDTNNDGSGTPYQLDISGNKTLSVKASSTVGVRIDLQIEDANGVKIEIKSTDNLDGSKDKLGFTTTTTPTVYTINLTGARVVQNWTCANWPTDCPTINTSASFDYTKVTKVVMLISGGTAYTGTVTLDDFKLGCAVNLGLSNSCTGTGTNAAAAILSSKLYPNPVSDMAKVELNLKASSAVKVTLSDMMGKEVAVITEGTFSSLTKEFSVANLKAGIYTVNYTINGEAAKAELLMVK